ncbi:hypothetical protein BSK59_13485 [Paenibacillus odorifer]|uniref:hypothetical protein n=1 Tax=Paenibacillus odorifer TaxID=189426 RepID=UPI00096CBF7B|nr:hypothetical protein [Paenibacillus odorifer]OME55483.1 hypothetical protein BSK59_13485 [Paenibacillus odorifer]
MRMYKFKIHIANKLSSLWYWLMKPLAYYYSSEKENARYEKRKSKISEEQLVKWIHEDIVRYLLKNKNSTIEILICTFANDDHFWSDCDLNGVAPYYLKRKKTRMAFYKFAKTLEIQEKIIEGLKQDKFVIVFEDVEVISSWKRIDNYKKTVKVKHNSR